MSPPRALADVRTLLAQTSPRGRALYGLVRRLLDELEAAAPWSALYAPPVDSAELAAGLGEMLERIERVPAQVAAELAALAAADGSAAAREAIDEADFYFTTLHQMTAADRQRLGDALARLAPASVATRAEADQLCELAADLKGKYTSAIMGAAAALVGEGRWRGWEFETQLFPEKAEEAERNRRLLGGLEAIVRALRVVAGTFAWRPLLDSWRAARPVDRYALGDLVALRAHLLRLLTVANRRALYSGDYQQLRERESRLGARLRELEQLHLLSLELPAGGGEPGTAELYARLGERLLEVAALVDVEIVRGEIGAASVQALRDDPAAATPEQEGLAALLAEEDLKTFLELLLGAVRKRASIAQRAPEAPAAAAVRAEEEPAALVGTLSPAAGREFGARLFGALERLAGAEAPRFKAFVMVHKLQERLGSLPPALWHEVRPFLAALDGDLLPVLDGAAAAGAVPRAAVETLRGAVDRLARHDPTSAADAPAAAADLGRVVRLVESLRAAAAALAGGR